MLNSVFLDSGANINILLLSLIAVLALILGMVIAFTHKFTSAYNKNFLITLSILPLLVSAVILLVNGNLGMGLVAAGTFSLVRFRSLPGTSKEILSVFFAMTVGLAVGMGYLLYAALLTVFASLAILFFHAIPFFEQNKYEKFLRITIPEDLDYAEVFDDILKGFTNRYELLAVKTTALGSMFELKYRIVLKKDCKEKEFIDALRIKNGNLKIILTHPTDLNDL